MRPSEPGAAAPAEAPGAADDVPRFDRVERWAHGTLAVLMLVCLATAAALYVPDLSARIGNRQPVSTAHVVAGWLLPVPLLAALVSRAYRRDLTSLNRFTSSDWAWLRSSDRRSGRIRVGKFNAGQKLNAAFTAGAVAVMVLTGSVMRLGAAPDDWKSGATFVHDWLALAVAVVAVGHLWMAARDPAAMLGMRTGRVPRWWAEAEHADWLDSLGASATMEARHPDTVGGAMTGTGTSLRRRLRWPWVVLAVVLFLAALTTGMLQSCSQAGGPPVCEPALHPVVPLSLGALGIAAVVVAVRRPDAGTSSDADVAR